jgi:hypothetical protein|tara:strand:+ start:982 stop:1557 length:576 start_codon:yes stop_codon:yes gene_type:complete
MSSIKLTADSGGGTFEIKAPSSSANTRVLTLPDTGNLTLGKTGILQVVQTVKTDTFSTASTSYTDVTGVSVSITPSSSSNKVLVMVEANSSTTGGNNAMFRLKRDSTTLSVGDAAGSRSQAAYQQRINDTNAALNGSITLLDSPSTTSSTTYQLQTKVQGGTVDINRTAANTDGAAYARTICTITAMEVAA